MTTKLTYSNPVISGFYPDPSVVRVDEDYYLATSSFEYFPGVPIFHSKDLIHWKQIGNALTRNSQLDLSEQKSSDGIFAPTIRYHQGIFYLITTDVRGIKNFVVTAADPAGPWSDPILIPHANIDPSLMFDDDGKVYVTSQAGFGADSHIIQFEINIKTGEALSEPVVICRGDGGVWTEGPHLYKIKGLYYLLCACGGTGRDHRSLVGKSTSPYGPFEMCPEPILTHNQLPEHELQNLGHADFVDDPEGNWWAVFLGVRQINNTYSVLGREIFLAPVTWTSEGWPLIDNNEGTVSRTMSAEHKDIESEAAILNTKETFKGPLDPSWAFIRMIDEQHISLTKRQGVLSLYGKAYTLNDDAVPTVFAGKRQQHHRMTASVLMEFMPRNYGEEAGLAARLHEEAHCKIAIKQEYNQKYIIAASQHGKAYTVHASKPLETPKVYLQIRSDEKSYQLAYSIDGLSWIQLCSVEASILSADVNGGFTGVVIGMYATGNGKPCTEPAYFHSYEYTALE
jgi:xylan 1,4-beta-xylosidase